MCVGKHYHVCGDRKGGLPLLSSAFYLSVKLEFSVLTRLAGPWVPGICTMKEMDGFSQVEVHYFGPNEKSTLTDADFGKHICRVSNHKR